VSTLRAFGRYFKDPDASLFGKLFVALAVAYVVMPLDLIPDVAPVIGWLDDLGIATMAAFYLSHVLHRYKQSPALIPAG
jgi:uncharacterized membrane protein YkvA (DUF1232 family)